MPPVSTRALVLHAFPYGETSKIVRLLTEDHGVQSGIAKGARRPKSKFGGRLQVLSQGVVQLYVKPNRDLHTLAEFDVTVQRQELTASVRRYAVGAALAELLMRFAPAEPHPDLFALAVAGLDRLCTTPTEVLDAVGLSVLWGVIGTLGFTPHLTSCARDGAPLPAGAVGFSFVEGGFLCPRCSAGEAGTTLPAADRAALERLVAGRTLPAEPLDASHARAHRRLLTRFVERHVAEGREVKALAFWEGLS